MHRHSHNTPEKSRVFETSHAYGADMAMHRHKYAYVSLALAGAYAEYSVDGRFEVRLGDLIFHPACHSHADTFSRDGAHIACVELLADDLPEAAFGVRLDRARLLAREIRGRPERAAEIVRDELESAGHSLLPRNPPRLVAPAAEAWRTGAALSVAAAARLAGVSAEHFSRVFKRHFGMGPAVYRGEQRFRQAARLIASGRGLAESAAACGYADQSHMTRDFQTRAMRTPSLYAIR